jgi:hypothetical protein
MCLATSNLHRPFAIMQSGFDDSYGRARSRPPGSRLAKVASSAKRLCSCYRSIVLVRHIMHAYVRARGGASECRVMETMRGRDMRREAMSALKVAPVLSGIVPALRSYSLD